MNFNLSLDKQNYSIQIKSDNKMSEKIIKFINIVIQIIDIFNIKDNVKIYHS